MVALPRKAVPSSENVRCQKCLEMGHWTYECKNKRKYVHRSSRTAQLRKRLKVEEEDQKVEKLLELKKAKEKGLKEKAPSSSSSSDSSSSDDESSSSDSSSSTSGSSSSSDTSSSSSDSSSDDSSTSSSDSSTDSSDSEDASNSSSAKSSPQVPHPSKNSKLKEAVAGKRGKKKKKWFLLWYCSWNGCIFWVFFWMIFLQNDVWITSFKTWHTDWSLHSFSIPSLPISLPCLLKLSDLTLWCNFCLTKNKGFLSFQSPPKLCCALQLVSGFGILIW